MSGMELIIMRGGYDMSEASQKAYEKLRGETLVPPHAWKPAQTFSAGHQAGLELGAAKLRSIGFPNEAAALLKGETDG